MTEKDLLQKRDDLIDLAMDIDQMRWIDDVEDVIKNLRKNLKYFGLDLDCIYLK